MQPRVEEACSVPDMPLHKNVAQRDRSDVRDRSRGPHLQELSIN
jgi:hypothetical protein